MKLQVHFVLQKAKPTGGTIEIPQGDRPHSAVITTEYARNRDAKHRGIGVKQRPSKPAVHPPNVPGRVLLRQVGHGVAAKA